MFNLVDKLAVVCRVAAMIVLLFLATAARGQDAGITVWGLGSVQVQPTVAQISGRISSGPGELANDAVVKFHGNKRRALEEIKSLKIPNLLIVEKGISYRAGLTQNMQQMMMMGGQAPAQTAKIQITEGIDLVLKDIDKLDAKQLEESLIRILDKASDVGLKIGGNPRSMMQMQFVGAKAPSIVMFKLTKSQAKQQTQKAYSQAMKDAQEKARLIAANAGVKLGRLLSLNQTTETEQPDRQMEYMWALLGASRPKDDVSNVATNVLAPIEITVMVKATFKIVE